MKCPKQDKNLVGESPSTRITFITHAICICSLWDRSNVFGNSDPVEGDHVTTGTPLSEPPLIDMMSNDPILRKVKVGQLWEFLNTVCLKRRLRVHIYVSFMVLF